jgi:hypothetical protein
VKQCKRWCVQVDGLDLRGRKLRERFCTTPQAMLLVNNLAVRPLTRKLCVGMVCCTKAQARVCSGARVPADEGGSASAEGVGAPVPPETGPSGAQLPASVVMAACCIPTELHDCGDRPRCVVPGQGVSTLLPGPGSMPVPFSRTENGSAEVVGGSGFVGSGANGAPGGGEAFPPVEMARGWRLRGTNLDSIELVPQAPAKVIYA